MKFLVLDDVMTNCVVLRQLAGKVFEAETVIATNPLDALARCHREQFDALIVDYFMPAMNGIEFTRCIRRLEGYRDIPIVMVTTADERRVHAAALQAGVTDFVNKPVCLVDFRERFGECLAGAQAA